MIEYSESIVLYNIIILIIATQYSYIEPSIVINTQTNAYNYYKRHYYFGHNVMKNDKIVLVL